MNKFFLTKNFMWFESTSRECGFKETCLICTISVMVTLLPSKRMFCGFDSRLLLLLYHKGREGMSRSLEELTTEEKRHLVDIIAKKKAGFIDEDWSEICDQFDLNINTETLRKAGVGIKLAEDAHMLGGVREDLSGGYVERQKIRDLTRQVNAMYRVESRSELLRESIAEAVKNLPPFSITTYADTLPENKDKALVVGLGDFHYGADILVEGLRGDVLNEYNHVIFERRMEKLLHDIAIHYECNVKTNIYYH